MGTQNELVQRLEDGYNKFSKGQKKLADFIREDYPCRKAALCILVYCSMRHIFFQAVNPFVTAFQ